MKKQFHFKNHPLTIKRATYCKPSTWIPREPNSTSLSLFLEQIEGPLSLTTPNTQQDPTSTHNRGLPSKNLALILT